MHTELTLYARQLIAECHETLVDRAYGAKRASLTEIIECCKHTRQQTQQVRALIDKVLAQSRTGLISADAWPPEN